MGRLTVEKEQQIYEVYQRILSYEKTARETSVTWRTVKRVVADRSGSEKLADNTRVNKSNSSVNAAKHSTIQNKVIYGELDRGINPIDIVKKYGFPSGVIEKEYEIYCRIKGSPELRELSRKMLDYTAATATPGLQEFEETCKKNGYLTVEQIMDLLEKLDSVHTDSENKRKNQGMFLPDGWSAISCNRCHTLVFAGDKRDPAGGAILEQYQGAPHVCGGQLVWHRYF